MNNAEQPAFPVEVEFDEAGMKDARTSNTTWQERGLTKREYFAGLAMQGRLASCSSYPKIDHNILAKDSLNDADALLNHLQNNQ